jgi:hypothetical protein
VRFSAAKGIGRISERLDIDMADQILSSVLELFTYVTAYHAAPIQTCF